MKFFSYIILIGGLFAIFKLSTDFLSAFLGFCFLCTFFNFIRRYDKEQDELEAFRDAKKRSEASDDQTR